MQNSSYRLFGLKALFVNSEIHADNADGRAARALAQELQERDVEVVAVSEPEDARLIIESDAAIQVALVDWDLPSDKKYGHAIALLGAIRRRNANLPIFVCADRSVASTIPLGSMDKFDDFIWLTEDTPTFIAGRVIAAMDRYRAQVLPPMFRALVQFAQVHEYSWHTPGHTGGTAFLKHPAGRAFFEFFGENTLRSDLSISVGALGSLLDHSGPIGAGEKYAARVFGAHRTYYVTNGSSTSNRVILMSSVTRDQVAMCDRNCHKSAEHAMTLSGTIPTWMMPSRNGLGIIGPIPPSRLTPHAIKKSIANNPLVKGGVDPTPQHAIITNSTYDGLCYNVTSIENLLGKSVDRLHFDEAWYGYARFNPLYRDRHAMHGDPKDHDPKGPTVFATQSTHKLLAALSQASYIHIRDGRRPIEHARFNEAFMMHASTSPNYAIIASNDVSAAMMDGTSGEALTGESIREAIAFRQMVARLNAECAAKKTWFFNIWQPDTVKVKGKKVALHAADPEHLATDPACWVLEPGAAWHGFEGLEGDWCMLDPIKVSVMMPGMSPDGKLAATGIPASIVTAYLHRRGIEVEKTIDFNILFLFSLGITKGKWGTLVSSLADFKRDYDANVSLERVMPDLVENYGSRYAGMGLKDLADDMFAQMKRLKTTASMSAGFSVLPRPDLSPVQAYEKMVKGEVETVTLEKMAGRIAATGVVPYPPGIPILVPGENAGPADGPILGYLKALEAYDRLFPGFTHDTHGVEVEDGVYHLMCIRK